MQIITPLCFIITLFTMASAHGEAGQLKQSLEVAEKTQKMGQHSQKIVNKLANQQQQLLEKYQKLLRTTEYQKEYNQELRILKEEQKENIAILQQKIEDVKWTKQQILPLLREMTKTLEQFIRLDLPFHRENRLLGVNELKTLLSRSSITVTEKFRRVMAFYQAENDYNYDLEVYRDNVELNSELLSVQILRVGRNALYVQTLDRKLSAIWNKHSQEWQILSNEFNRPIQQAMRVAGKKTAPNLLTLPYLTMLDQPSLESNKGAK
ncbi:DUF3450 domain-containing protein [Oceaniserpentilla sp. 4NH20-0058]|uniref:DUF3450 domain-containing protein n=1 Tax=Oceaniserpentilla sp. 4NH20-0058 TaxID=3127660 RepID=UPI00310A55DF